jgi:hypothetical protein
VIVATASPRIDLQLGPLLYLRPGEVEPNPWNPNKMDGWMYAKAIDSIAQFGMVDPVLVRQLVVKGRYQLIDGEHRAKACVDLGLLIPAHSVGEINDTVARKLTIALNEVHGTANPAEMGKLLDELLSEGSLDELLEGIPMTAETVRAFTNAAGIEWPDSAPPVAPPPDGHSAERWVERTYRIPRDVAEVLDEALAKAKGRIERDGSIATDARALEVIAAEYMAS